VNVLLRGGIAGYPRADGSDLLGVYAAPTEALHGLTPPEPVISKMSAGVLLEAREFCVRALECEPEPLRLLWLPQIDLETRTPLGDQLIEIREAFLSRLPLVKAYSHAMGEQLNTIERRRSTVSHREVAAHELYRLGQEAVQFCRYGRIQNDLPDEDRRAFVADARENPQTARDYVSDVAVVMGEETPLPIKPRSGEVESWLAHVRARYFIRG
jgi:uncharacterized protein